MSITRILDKKLLQQFVSRSKWSIRQIVDTNPESVVTEKALTKLLRMSGLKPHESSKASLVKSLNLQLSFIKSLYGPDDTVSQANNDTLFRLMKSDTDLKPLTLKELKHQVSLVDKQVDPEKGEVGYAKNDYFVVKQRL